MSLKKKFVYFIVIPIIILSILLWLILNLKFNSYNKEISFEEVSNSSNLFSMYIYDRLKADKDVLKTLENVLERDNLNLYKENKTTFQLLKNVLIQNHNYKAVWYIIKSDNEIDNPKIIKVSKENQKIVSSEKTLNTKDLNYKNILLKASAGEKEIFISNNHKNDNIISISIPLKVNYTFVGICSIDMNFKEILSNYYKKFTGKNQYNFILTDNNDFIGNSDIDFIKDDFINALDSKQTDYNTNKKITFDFNSGNEQYFASVKQLSLKSGNSKWQTSVIIKNQKDEALFSELYYPSLRLFFILIIIALLLFWFIYFKIINRLNETKKVINAVAYGRLEEIKKLNISSDDELSEINASINKLNNNLDNTAKYIEEIYKGNITFDYKPVSKNDKIGNLTVELAKNIKHSKEEEEKRKREDTIQNWITKGAALFAEIIRDYSDNLEELSYAIVSKLVNYTDADQGGIFVINENEKNEKSIELLASYAYDRRKMLEKRIPYGVGLVGRCILERETIFMTKIPDNYLNITSGLGDDKPKTLIIVPLIFHEEVYGVVELASFKYLDEYKIKLIEQVSESIASAISMVKINTRTAELLRETKIKSEQSASQEEEIRQNIEEMQAVSDGLNQKLEEVSNTLSAIKETANIAEFDMQGRITEISDNYLKLLKKERGDIIGKVQGSFSSEAPNPESFKKFWDELKKGKVKEFTQVIQVNDKMLKISSTYHPVRNAAGNVFKVVSIANIV